MENKYGYYELEYHQTEQGRIEQEHIDYLCNELIEEYRREKIELRKKKIIKILNEYR